jgi:Domain of unknown function (DUF4384)
MKLTRFIPLLAIMVFTLGYLIVSAQQPGDEDVRGAFLSSRPKTTNANAPSHRHKPRRTTSTSAGASVSVSSGNLTTANANRPTSRVKTVGPIGLGYTLFMRDQFGRAVRVDPTHAFHNGDSVRVSLEPSIDGYLYIFHTENDGLPEMIYPDSRLDYGDNLIDAHVPVEVPSSEATDERLRWFTFYGNGGVERLYIVVTRDPLPGVPTGDTLVSFCAANKDRCPWHPAADVWAQVQVGAKADVKIVTSSQFGQPQSNAEVVATTRGLGLDQSAPQPSVIRMTASTKAPVLVTVLDLLHQ